MKKHISFLLFEGMTALDFIGPAAVLTNSGMFDVDYVWRSKNPVQGETRADKTLGFLPTATFADVSHTDILCVPGTSNPYPHIVDGEMLDWVAAVGEKAEWVTSVCTGSLILGAAGLLKGYKATTHWTMLDDLEYFGATPALERVVHDRNRVTGAGVTSGIDFGLVLLSMLCGEDLAKVIQLALEYDPAPPFSGGSPKTADPALVEQMRAGAKPWPYVRKNLEKAARRIGLPVQ